MMVFMKFVYRPLIVICILMSVMVSLQAQTNHVLVTDDMDIIYPSSYQREAVRMHESLEAVLSGYRNDFSIDKAFQWTGILEETSIYGNGYVSLPLPITSWQVNPNISIIHPDTWYEMMAIHEGRHIAQYEALNRGITRIAYYAGGPALMGGLTHITIPKWMLEGDAVVSETIYSDQGRGRQAAFERSMKALILEQPDISYQKVVNSSYLRGYPNHYVYGYFLTGYLMNSYGKDVIPRLFDEMGRNPIPLWRVTQALQSVTGEQINQQELFTAAKEDLYGRWSEADNGLEPTDREIIFTPQQKGAVEIVDFHIGEHGVYAVTWDGTHGLSGALYDTDTGEQTGRRLKLAAGPVDISDRYIAVIESRTHLFGESESGVLALYERRNGKTQELGRGQFFGNPAISPNEQYIAVSVFDSSVGTAVEVYSVEGELAHRFEPQDSMFFTHLSWLDEQTLAVIANQGSTLYLMRMNLDGSETEILHEFEDEFITSMRADVHTSTVYIGSDRSGTEELYSITDDGTPQQRTISRFGVFQPFVYDKELYAIEQVSFDRQAAVRLSPQEIEDAPERRTEYVSSFYDPHRFFPLSRESTKASVTTKPYSVEDYVGTLYGWGLISDGIDAVGIGLRGADPLVSHIWELSLRYSLPADRWSTYYSWLSDGDALDVSLSGELYHDPMASDSYGIGYSVGMEVSQRLLFERHRLQTSHRYGLRAFTTSSQLFQGAVFYDVSIGTRPAARGLQPFETGFWQYSELQLYPYQGELLYRLYARSSAYLPGPLPDDTISAVNRMNFRNINNLGNTPLGWYLQPARGFESEEIESSGTWLGTVTLQYDVPFFYPDLSVFNVMFLKRVRAQAFTDMSYSIERIHPSAGLELTADLTLFNMPRLEISTGVRLAVRLTDYRPVFSFLLLGAAL
jgi:hypothetical protein